MHHAEDGPYRRPAVATEPGATAPPSDAEPPHPLEDLRSRPRRDALAGDPTAEPAPPPPPGSDDDDGVEDVRETRLGGVRPIRHTPLPRQQLGVERTRYLLVVQPGAGAIPDPWWFQTQLGSVGQLHALPDGAWLITLSGRNDQHTGQVAESVADAIRFQYGPPIRAEAIPVGPSFSLPEAALRGEEPVADLVRRLRTGEPNR